MLCKQRMIQASASQQVQRDLMKLRNISTPLNSCFWVTSVSWLNKSHCPGDPGNYKIYHILVLETISGDHSHCREMWWEFPLSNVFKHNREEKKQQLSCSQTPWFFFSWFFWMRKGGKGCDFFQSTWLWCWDGVTGISRPPTSGLWQPATHKVLSLSTSQPNSAWANKSLLC